MSAIDDKYLALGAAASFLGNPTTAECLTPNGQGSYRHYQGGSIYWKHALPVACEVHGQIRSKWEALGWENSFLGFPLTDETSVAGGRGRANTFEGGAIAWTPTTGAHEVHGAIFARWAALGRENTLGFPLTDECVTPDTRGRYNHFENGSIYWTPATGAHEVTGYIKDAWARGGWEQGPLGYPVGGPDQMRPSTSPTDFQDFEHGSLYDWLGHSRTLIPPPARPQLGDGSKVILWSDLGTLLPDRDRISAQFTGHATEGNIQITLNAGPGITAWKGVALYSASKHSLIEAWTQDNHRTTTITLPPSDVGDPKNIVLIFSKAKALGVHTRMYWITRIDRLIGNNVVFTWLQDQ